MKMQGDFIELINVSTSEVVKKKIVEVDNIGGRLVYVVGPFVYEGLDDFYYLSI